MNLTNMKKSLALLFAACLFGSALFLGGCSTKDNDLPESVYKGARDQRSAQTPGGGQPQPGGGAPQPGGAAPGTEGH